MVWSVIVLWLIFSSPLGAAEPRGYDMYINASRRATTAGEAKKALQFYETRAVKLEKMARGEGSRRIFYEAAALNYREASNVARILGELQKALDFGKRALALGTEFGDPSLQLRALSSLHQAYRDVGNDSKAKELIDAGLELARNVYSPRSVNRSYWEAIFAAKNTSYFRAQHRYEKAIKAGNRALEWYEVFLSRMPDVDGRPKARREKAVTNMVFIYDRIGRSYLALGKTEDAFQQYERGLELARRGNLKFTQISLFQGLGEVYEQRGQYAAALNYFNKALELARQQQRSSQLASTARRVGDLYRKLGKKQEAATAYREAIEQMESIRSLLSLRRNRQSYFGYRLAAYTGLIEILWEQGAYREAFRVSERIRARTFLDMMGTRVQLLQADSPLAGDELALAESEEKRGGKEDYREFLKKISKVNPEQVSLMSVRPLALRDVQRLLRPDQLLLEYLVTPARTYLWAIERTRLRAYVIPIARKKLVAEIGVLRGAIATISPLDAYQRIAQVLYDQLLSPALSANNKKDLIVVSHDVLHYLPFHALSSPDGRYLVENFRVTYLSTASLLKFAKSKSRARTPRVLAIGNPKRQLPQENLRSAEWEVQEVKKNFPETTVLLQQDAGEGKIKSMAQKFDVLHFAAHTELHTSDPLSSSILLAKDDGEDGRLEVREILGMNLNANLVVLSGCETGLGRLSSGDEFVGLTRAFLYAGTSSVVASLWKVDDESTARLMGNFYKDLTSTTKAEALRQAELEMIRGERQDGLFVRRGVGGIGKLGDASGSPFLAISEPPDPKSVSTSHPYFWAPFILVGEGD